MKSHRRDTPSKAHKVMDEAARALVMSELASECGNHISFAARLAFENALPDLNQAKVSLDQSGERRFQRELKQYPNRRVRQSDGGRAVSAIMTMESRRDNLLHAADYVAGVCNRLICDWRDGRELWERFLAGKEATRRT